MFEERGTKRKLEEERKKRRKRRKKRKRKIESETENLEKNEEVEDDDEEEVIEIEIDGQTYYCDNEENGNIYEDNDGEVGDIVGELKDGEALFFE